MLAGMRITVDLAPAVADSLRKLEERTGLPRASLAHEALRLGVAQLEEPRRQFVQETISVGGVRLQNLDDIGGVLALLDEEE
jgi:hypothetical protein